MMRRLAALCGVALALAPWHAVDAATVQTADFKPGTTLGVGLQGLSYDRGFGNFDLGAVIGDPALIDNNDRIKLGLRGLYRLFQVEGLSAGLIAGLQYDPGGQGSRA